MPSRCAGSRSVSTARSPSTICRSPSRKGRSTASSDRMARQDDDSQDDHAHPAADQANRSAGSRDTAAHANRVGYLPEERGLYKKMTIRRLLRYYARLKGGTRAGIDAAIEEWMQRLELPGLLDRPIETLSKGMSQKVQFVSAVVSNPSLLILDEPFSGLDPVNAQVVKDAVLEVRRRGTTVVFSTHDMSTAERMCDRIFMSSADAKCSTAHSRASGSVRRRYRARPDLDRRAAWWHAGRRSRQRRRPDAGGAPDRGPQAFLARLSQRGGRLSLRVTRPRCRTFSCGLRNRRKRSQESGQNSECQDDHERQGSP